MWRKWTAQFTPIYVNGKVFTPIQPFVCTHRIPTAKLTCKSTRVAHYDHVTCSAGRMRMDGGMRIRYERGRFSFYQVK